MTEEVKTMKYLLIRADDLGYSEGVNYGIAATVAAGLVRSVGVMTNMPAAVHGLGLLHGHSLCLGQHTNICVGRPLTDPSHIPSLCTPEGEFRPSRTYREAAKAGRDFVVLEEVIEEIEAQYRQFKALSRITLRDTQWPAQTSSRGWRLLPSTTACPTLPWAVPARQ